MEEVPFAGEDHGHAVLVGGSDQLVAAEGTARLDHHRDLGGGCSVEAVAERVERVGGARSALGATRRLPGCDLAGVDPALLAGADTDGLTAGDEHDRVRLDVSAQSPRQL